MKFSCFEEVDKEVTVMYNDGRFEEAVDLLKTVVEQYPDNLYTITWDMAVIYSLMTPTQGEKIMEILEYGYEKDLWYNLDPEDMRWKSCKESSRFHELVKKNKLRKELAQAKADKKYEIYMPADYYEEKKYPLHIAIHGWGEDIAFFRKFWTSDVLTKDFISLFIQSSRVATSEGYCWDDIELARKEIKDVYEDILHKYPIDINNITVGGFSQGGTMTLDFALNEMIPIKGFIALCPDQPNGFTKEGVESMVARNIKGIILTGENDGALPEQKAMVDIFEEVGLPYKFIINKDLGHWFPENLSEQMDHGLDYVAAEAEKEHKYI